MSEYIYIAWVAPDGSPLIMRQEIVQKGSSEYLLGQGDLVFGDEIHSQLSGHMLYLRAVKRQDIDTVKNGVYITTSLEDAIEFMEIRTRGYIKEIRGNLAVAEDNLRRLGSYKSTQPQ